jgi:organic hydroperoxide reductase OsmC/OhrA
VSTLKDFLFHVEAASLPRRRVRLTSEGKLPLETATPPEFRDGTPGMWSPEDLLVAAVASCYVLTLEAIAARREIPLQRVQVKGAGHVTRRVDGRVGFVVVELRVEILTDPGLEEAVEALSHSAERGCLIAHALSVPVEVELDVRTRERPAISMP